MRLRLGHGRELRYSGVGVLIGAPLTRLSHGKRRLVQFCWHCGHISNGDNSNNHWQYMSNRDIIATVLLWQVHRGPTTPSRGSVQNSFIPLFYHCHFHRGMSIVSLCTSDKLSIGAILVIYYQDYSKQVIKMGILSHYYQH